MNPQDEWSRRLARGGMAGAALLMVYLASGKVVRDALFLSQFAPHDLARIVMASAVSALAAAALYATALRFCSPSRVLFLLLTSSAALHAAEWQLLSFRPAIAIAVLYVHVASVATLALSGLWSILNENLDPHTAKAVFPKVSSCGVVGGLTGAIVIATILPGVRALPFLAAVQVAAAIAVLGLKKEVGPQTPTPTVEYAGAAQTLTGARYLLALASVVLLSACCSQLIDLVMKLEAKSRFADAVSLSRFLGAYHFVTALLVVPVQAYLAPRLLEKRGLASAAGTLPGVVALGGIAGAITPVFPVVVAAVGAEAVVRRSVYRAAYELFYTPLRPTEKRSTKSLIDLGADRGGEAAGAALFASIMALGPYYRPVFLAAALLSAGTLILLRFAGRGYVAALERNLLARALDIDSSEIRDMTTRATITRVLAPRISSPAPPVGQRSSPTDSSPDPVAVRLADLRSRDAGRVLAALAGTGPLEPALVPQAITLLAWNLTSQAAAGALAQCGQGIVGQLADALLNPAGEFAIRRRVPRLLGKLAVPRAAAALLEGLRADRFEVRLECARALNVLVQDHPELGPEPGEVWDAIDRELSVSKTLWNSYTLLEPRRVEGLYAGLDAVLAERARHGLEHVFSLLALVLPHQTVKITFHALHSDDRYLRGTALEYLESVLPQTARTRLWELIGEKPGPPPVSRKTEEIVGDLIRSHQSVMENLQRKQEGASDGSAVTK